MLLWAENNKLELATINIPGLILVSFQTILLPGFKLRRNLRNFWNVFYSLSLMFFFLSPPEYLSPWTLPFEKYSLLFEYLYQLENHYKQIMKLLKPLSGCFQILQPYSTSKKLHVLCQVDLSKALPSFCIWVSKCWITFMTLVTTETFFNFHLLQ